MATNDTNELNNSVPFDFIDFGPTNEILLSIGATRFSIFRSQEQTFLLMADRYRDPRPILSQRTRQVISKVFCIPCIRRGAGRASAKRSFYFHTVNSNVHQRINISTIKKPMIPPIALSKGKSF